MKQRHALAAGATLCLLALSPACQLSERAITVFNLHVGPVFGVRLENIDGPKASPSPSPLKENDHKRLNMEFLRELHQVVLERDPTNEEYARWMNVLDQGGSYEGIYNGVVNGEEFTSREKSVAPVSALRLYSDLMTKIALDIKYDPLKIRAEKAEAESLGIPQDPTKPESPQPTEAEKKQLLSEYAVKAVNKSLNTLRREAGADALKLMEIKRAYREKFATWFGRFVIYTNAKGVSFGIEARNKGDEYYHYKWALENDDDRVRWEILNRIHRLFNATKN